MSEFKVGATKLNTERNYTSTFKVHKIEEGDNVFRLLPPLWSLAEEGRYYKYWKIHWGFYMSNGRAKPIVCTERKDRNGVITEHCPICDMVALAQKEYDFMKENGASKEELADFYKKRILAFQAQGHYYTYAINTQNEIGLLKLKKSMKDGFEKRYAELEKEGIQANGINGVFVNIKRTGKMRDTEYTVDIFMESDPNNPRAKIYKEHTITPELLEKIKRETQDLATMYSLISVEEMALLVNESDPELRASLMDKIFSKSERSDLSTQTKSMVPGTSAVMVGELVYDYNKSQVVHSSPTAVNEVTETKVKTKQDVKKPTDNITVQTFTDEEAFLRAFEERFNKK